MLDSGTTVFPHGTFTAKAYADDATGVLRAYGYANEIQNGPVSTAPNPVIAEGAATVSGRLSLVGPGSGPVSVSVFMDFDGTFSGPSGGNSLGGQIVATQTSGGAVSSWTSALSFEQYGTGPLTPISIASKSLPGVFDTSFVAGTPVVVSTAPSALQGRVLVPLTLMPGQSFDLSVSLTARSGAHGDGCPFMSYCGSYDGTVDGYNTGQLSFALPASYLLVGAGGAFASVPTVPVPEPDAYALMLAGLGLLAGLARRQAKKS
jgi:hypothetical protein